MELPTKRERMYATICLDLSSTFHTLQPYGDLKDLEVSPWNISLRGYIRETCKNFEEYNTKFTKLTYSCEQYQKFISDTLNEYLSEEQFGYFKEKVLKRQY